MLAALTLITVLALQSPQLTDGLALAVRQNRAPIPTDPVVEAMVTGKWQPPVEGNGWKRIKAKENGWFEDDLLDGAYVDIKVETAQEGVMLLSAAGHSMVYVNGVPRAGDPYSYEYLTLPIRLRQGQNDLLFLCGRGRLKASLQPPPKQVELDPRDLTTPDVLSTDTGRLRAAIVVRNSAPDALKDLTIQVGEVKTKVPAVLGESTRKVPFAFAVPRPLPRDKVTLHIKAIQNGKILDEKSIDLRVRGAKQTYKRTFVSGIDGSLQYYVVNPAQEPSSKNNLVLSVHGASVEATNQADAYASKTDTTVIAATNRRPYGYDWEDWGRIDALEVLNEAKRTIVHDPLSVHITGHSMGGHGTWYIGTLYPDIFATVSPAAGWISWWSYGGGWNPKQSSTDEIVRRAMNHLDPLTRLTNTLAQGVFVLHGDADDNVPVGQARRMKTELEKIQHPDFGYHEVPGAGHWWSNEAVDFAGIFNLIRRRRLNTDPDAIDFVTPNPTISSRAWWATVLQQQKPLELSRIQLRRGVGSSGKVSITGTTNNVRALELTLPGRSVNVILDGQTIEHKATKTARFVNVCGKWDEILGSTPLEPVRVLKDAFENQMVFVYGTHGTTDENDWARNKARYDAESWYYRGNGAVDVVPDTDASRYRGRNVILYGNAKTNKAWSLINTKGVRLENGSAKVGDRVSSGTGIASLAVVSGRKGILVGVVGGTGLEGMKRTDRAAYLSPASAFPSWLLFDAQGIVGDGFYGHDWRVDEKESAWRESKP